MRLLIVTQIVDKDDSILGFFHRWIIEFAKNCESIIVICLKEGKHDLPANVKVLSLGKEDGASRIKYVARFYSYIWSERKNYDAVFVHMNPIYVVLGGLIWRLIGKNISLWYTHKNVDIKLRIANSITNHIFTASQKSFRMISNKVIITGHGIDTDYFVPDTKANISDQIRLVSIGRISPVKNYEVIIETVLGLNNNGRKTTLTIVGSPITDNDRKYLESLKDMVAESDQMSKIIWVGSVSQNKILPYLQDSDIFVNTSNTGSLDKAVLEAMSCGVKVLTSNEAFGHILEPIHIFDGTSDDLVDKIIALSQKGLDSKSRDYVVKYHNINNLVPMLVDRMV